MWITSARSDLDDCIQSEVYVQDLQCGEPVESLYTANFQDVCLLLRGDSMMQEYYPQCEDCQDTQKLLNLCTCVLLGYYKMRSCFPSCSQFLVHAGRRVQA